jgi:hypothetical protein
MGQLMLSMGLVWREIPILAQRATTWQGIFALTAAQVLIIPLICCKYASRAIHIFSYKG